MPNVLMAVVPYLKVTGLSCNICDRPDQPVASVGYEWGHEFCSRCLRLMADDLENESVKAQPYEPS